MKTTTIDYALWIHTLPDEFQKPLAPDRQFLTDTRALYEFLIQSRLIWKVWMLDEWGRPWIHIHRMGPDGQPTEDTLLIHHAGAFDKIPTTPYEVEDERVS